MMILPTNNEHSSKEVESGEDHCCSCCSSSRSSSRIITTNNTEIITERDVEIGVDVVGRNLLLVRDDNDDDGNNVDSTSAKTKTTQQPKGSISAGCSIKFKSKGYDDVENNYSTAVIAAAAATTTAITNNNDNKNFSTISNCSSTSHSSNRVKISSTRSSNGATTTTTTTTTRNKSTKTSCSSSSSRIVSMIIHNRYILSLFIVMVGVAVCCLFLKLGIHSETKSSTQYFHQAATDIAQKIELSWHDYEIFSLWAHESCHKFPKKQQKPRQNQQTSDTNTTTTPEEEGESTFLEEKLHICSREEFRNLYEHISSVGLNLYSLQYVTRVEHQYREMYETDSRQYLATHYPHIPYTGITARNGPELFNQTNQEVYYPVSRVEPIEGNEAAIDLDTYHSAKALIDQVLSSWKPTLSPGVKLIQDRDPDAYSVYLVHPGLQTSIHKEAHSVTSTVIRIHDLLSWAATMGDGGSINGKAVYIFDSTDQEKEPTFLGGIKVGSTSSSRGGGKNGNLVDVSDDGDVVNIKPLEETTIKKVQSSNLYSDYFETELNIVNRRWTVSGTFFPCYHQIAFSFRGIIIQVSVDPHSIAV